MLSSKTSAKEKEVMPLPESNVVDPSPAGDLILQISGVEDELFKSNESLVIGNELLNGNDKCWPKVRIEECKTEIQIRSVLNRIQSIKDRFLDLVTSILELLFRCAVQEAVRRKVNDFQINGLYDFRTKVFNRRQSLTESISKNEIEIRYPWQGRFDRSQLYKQGLQCDTAWTIEVIGSEMLELRKLLNGGNCGKFQIPAMNPVWTTGQNMTLEEKTWEHFLFCYERGSHGNFSLSHFGLFLPWLVYCLLITLHNLRIVILACKDAGNEITVAGSQGNSADNVDEVTGIIEPDSEENNGDNAENKINEIDSAVNFGSNVDTVGKLIEANSAGNSGDNVVERLNKEELLSNDEGDTIVTSTDTYLAEYNEQTDSLSLAGTSRIDNKFITFVYEFKSKFFKHPNRKLYLEYPAEVTESVEKGNIDYDEEAFDAVCISLKKNNTREMFQSRYTFNDKDNRKTHWVLSEDFEEMSHAVFSAEVTPTNELRFNRSKIVEVEVIEQSCSNIENFEGSKYKPAVNDDKQIRAVGDEVSNCSYGLATLVTNFFNDNHQQQNNATVAVKGNINLIETTIKEAESLNERLCKRNKSNLSDKQGDVVDNVDHNGNMAEIRAMSLLSNLNDLPFPRIDTSYLTTSVYRIEEPLLALIDRIASGNPPTPHISMRYELLRFCTLRRYPRGDKPYLIRLAAAGFYYASDEDGVVCYCCGSRRYNWTGREDPMKVHQGIKPNCNFFTNNEDVNVPVVCNGPWSKSLLAIEAIPEPHVITQEGENVNREYAPARQRNQESVNEHQTLGINNATPKHSQYTCKSERLNSYWNWPYTSKLKPEELADAGFFYAGFGDCVRCFFCGIGLRHWEDEDNPWIEHARWTRTCVFVRQKKGEEFVNLVQFAAVQLSQDNGQAGATVEGSSNTNSLPVSTIEKLLSKAALSAAELGFHTEIITRAVEEMIKNGVTDNISPDDLLCKVLEIKGRDKRAAAATAGTAASRDTKKGNGNFLHDPVAIKHENEVIKEQMLCKICLEHNVCIVFLPCGHLVTCADCSPGIHKCFICKELVKGTVRASMS